MVTCQSHNLKLVGSIPASGNFFMFSDLLIYISILPLIGILLILLFSITDSKSLKLISLNFSVLPFLGSLIIWTYFEK